MSVLRKTLETQRGVLILKKTLVCRGSYCGRNILAPNSDFNCHADHRGYVPVERWILSITSAGNEIQKENEGLSLVSLLDGKEYFLKHLIRDDPTLLGGYSTSWPLTKVLDIGGKLVRPNFEADESASEEAEGEETPPIPCHCHAGLICNGKAVGPGKLEAYFFPPVEGVDPYQRLCKLEKRVITRLGFKPNVTKEQVIEALKRFGKSDRVYSLCNVFEIRPNEGWTIRPGVVHAPGPWPTFEIQRAQDDFNFLGWQLGKTIDESELEIKRNEFQLRGLKDEETFLNEVVDWERSVDPNFQQSFHRPLRLIEEGDWGRRFQIFFDEFYGEGYEIKASHSVVRASDARPWGGIAWSGRGKINGNSLDAENDDRSEFLVTPNTTVEITASETTPLFLYTVFPIIE